MYHLKPPLAIGRVRADRFSPYWHSPEQFGIVRLRPHRAFSYVFPFSDSVLAKLAYYHEFDTRDGRDPKDYVGPVIQAVHAWQQLDTIATLRIRDQDNKTLMLYDTRPNADCFQRHLTGEERIVYLFCDRGRSLAAILKHLTEVTGRKPDEDAIRATLDQWLKDRIIVFLDGQYLSLALAGDARGCNGTR